MPNHMKLCRIHPDPDSRGFKWWKARVKRKLRSFRRQCKDSLHKGEQPLSVVVISHAD